jgi:hypothetical protein
LRERQERLARSRAKSNANLRPFTSENQPPGWKKSRKGILNRSTVFKLWMKAFDELEVTSTGKKTKSSLDWTPIEWE